MVAIETSVEVEEEEDGKKHILIFRILDFWSLECWPEEVESQSRE